MYKNKYENMKKRKDWIRQNIKNMGKNILNGGKAKCGKNPLEYLIPD